MNTQIPRPLPLRVLIHSAFFILLLPILLIAFSGSASAATATKYIRATGGDCVSIGTWNSATLTCTMNTDLVFGATNGIVIDGGGVTLDGAGHSITGGGGLTSGVSAMVRNNFTVKNLTIRQFVYGVNLVSTINPTITGNTIAGNTYGVYLSNVTNGRVYNNNFDANTNQAAVSGGSGNVFSLPAPIGGNWWSAFDAPVEGCNNYNGDYYCDAALTLTGGSDALPWVSASAWSSPPPPDTAPPAIVSIDPSGIIQTGTTTITVRYTDPSNIDLASGSITLDGDPVAGCTVTESQISCPAVGGYVTGMHAIGGSVADIHGNTATISGSFNYVDDLAPVISALAPSGFVGTASPTISAAYVDSGTGVDLASVIVTLDGSVLSGCTAAASGVTCPSSGLADGAHAFLVSVTDNNGNTASMAGSFSVDTTAPAVTRVLPAGTINTGSTTVSISFSDAGSGINTASLSVYLDATKLTGCSVSATAANCAVKNLPLGAHTISGSIADRAGNIRAISGAFTFSDTAAPVISNLKPPILVNKPYTVIGATLSDVGTGVNTASVAVYLDGGAVSGCSVTTASASCTVYGLSLGAHTFSLRAGDMAGNIATASGSFTYDPNAPTVASTVYISANGGGCSQIGTWFPAIKSCVLKDDFMFINSNGIIVIGNGVTVDGNGHFIIGTGGNMSGVNASISSGVTIKNLTIKQFRYGVYLQASNNSTLYNNTFMNNGYGAYLASSNNNLVYNNSFIDNTIPVNVNGGTGNQFSKAAPDGGNFWSTFDTAGEGCSDADSDGFCDAAYSVYGASDSLPWTASAWPQPLPYDPLAPVITGITPTGSISTSSAVVGAYYEDDGTGVDASTVLISLDGLPLPGCSITAASASCTVYDLGQGSHTIQVQVKDKLGNQATATGSFSVDSQAPQISNILPSGGITTSTATVSAYYEDAGTGVNAASAAVYLDGSAISGCAITASTASCAVYGLTEGAHTIQVRVADMAGNNGSASGTFYLDFTPPYVGSIYLAPGGSPDSAVAAAYVYDTVSGIDSASLSVYVEGGTVSDCGVTGRNASCSVYGLAEGAHMVTVSVMDNAGNTGAASGQYSIDTVPPQVSGLFPTGTVNKTSAAIGAYLSDAGSGIDTAAVAVYVDGGPAVSGCTVTSAKASCNVYNLAEGAHSYVVQASDNAGNSATASASFTVDSRQTVKYLRDTVTGGDCTLIGTWNNTTKTCTLTSDYVFSSSGIMIDANNLTLDGAGHRLTGAGGFASAISIYVRSNVTVKNLSLRQFGYGFSLISTNNVRIFGNNVASNTWGIALQNANNTQVYRNNFNSNTNQTNISGGSGNVFFLAAPTGGNWWSNFDTPAEGCSDANSDGSCDASYIFTGGRDDLPHVLEYPFPAG